MNFARGDLVVKEDILAALDEKAVKVYITDFLEDEYLDHPGIIGLPHLGASTPESEDNCASMAAEELIDFLENGNITNSVNLPPDAAGAVGSNLWREAFPPLPIPR